MTWTAVGGLNPNANAGTTSFSLTPSGVGNLIVMIVHNDTNNTVTATNLSSTNVTWTLVGNHKNTVGNASTTTMFTGTVSAASAATVTITWSGTTPTTVNNVGQEFHSTAGSWFIDATGFVDSTGTNTWATLTPTGSGRLYYGWTGDLTTGSGGSTPGFIYTVTSTNDVSAYNLNVSSVVTPTQGDSNAFAGFMALIAEQVGGVPQYSGLRLVSAIPLLALMRGKP